MAAFELVTRWRLRASIEAVWNALHDVQAWPTWWYYVERVEVLEPGADDGLGALHEYCWRTRLPYRIRFRSRTTRVDRPRHLVARIDGELVGSGSWTLSRSGTETDVTHRWEVDAKRPWMRVLPPIAAPVFGWNHRGVMRAGEESLQRHLGVDRAP